MPPPRAPNPPSPSDSILCAANTGNNGNNSVSGDNNAPEAAVVGIDKKLWNNSVNAINNNSNGKKVLPTSACALGGKIAYPPLSDN